MKALGCSGCEKPALKRTCQNYEEHSAPSKAQCIQNKNYEPKQTLNCSGCRPGKHLGNRLNKTA